jgi:hypothetical protein
MSDSVAITFTKYELLAVTRDGFDYQLDYSYVPSDLVGQPEEVAETRDGTVVVGISRTLATSWRLGREDLEKVLFESAKRHVRAKAEEGSLGGSSEVKLTTANAARPCPFDPARIQLGIGTPIHFEMPKRNPVAAAAPASGGQFDLFLSYASEDKEAIARPLYTALVAAGVSVWFDDAVLELGDGLRRKIDEGLARCRYGVVILSPRFLAKQWPQRELDGLVARETASGEKAILPIWHELDRDALLRYSPPLADRLAGRSEEGVSVLVEKILRVLRK